MTAILYHTWFVRLRHLRPKEHTTRLQNFSWLVVGLLLSQSVHLSHIARKIPGTVQQESKVRRLRRLLKHGPLCVRDWYEPLARQLIAAGAASGQPLRLMVDGTRVGAGHQLLMVALAYRHRALPIAWTWVCRGLGHSDATKQMALLGYVHGLVPPGAAVEVVGDNAFGAVAVMQLLCQWGWRFVLRQKGQTTLRQPGRRQNQRLDSLLSGPGQRCWLPSVHFTYRYAFGVHVLAYWPPGEDEPWLLTTNLPTPQQTLRSYRRRMWIEGMFADFKRHGFDLEATRLRHFLRLSRLTLAVALLYLHCIALGSSIVKRGLRYLVDRTDRRDLSIFRIGLEMIERLLTNGHAVSLRLLPYFR